MITLFALCIYLKMIQSSEKSTGHGGKAQLARSSFCVRADSRHCYLYERQSLLCAVTRSFSVWAPNWETMFFQDCTIFFKDTAKDFITSSLATFLMEMASKLVPENLVIHIKNLSMNILNTLLMYLIKQSLTLAWSRIAELLWNTWIRLRETRCRKQRSDHVILLLTPKE